MPRFLLALAFLLSPVVVRAADPIGPNDWPWWRGPNRNGTAPAQKLPLKWSETENIVWKAPVPGRGHGSPIVVGEHVYLPIAEPDTEVQSVLCLDRKTGKELWKTPVHRGGWEKGGNAKSSLASATLACDGEQIYANFLHNKAIYTTALDRTGKQRWQTKITDYVLHQGFGSSPGVHGSLVLVTADNKGGGVVMALDRTNGKEVWHQSRPKAPNYASPIVLKAADREQLIVIGCDLVSSFDPLKGTKLWEIQGATTECVTSTITDGKHVFTSGGYPRNHVAAVLADGSGKVVWDKPTRVYVPSMLVRDGHLYGVMDSGVAFCWKCGTGEKVWEERLGGDFTASPVLVGDRIYATNEAGRTFIFKATPGGYEALGDNKLGDEVYATATICGDRIYLRVAFKKDGRRDEVLYCIGK